MKVYLCKFNKIKLEVVIDVVVDDVVNKEVAKVVDEVNKELVKEVNEGFVLVDVVRVVEVIIKLTVVIEMMWCWTRRLTWRSTRRLIRKWPKLSTSRWLRNFGYFWRKY